MTLGSDHARSSSLGPRISKAQREIDALRQEFDDRLGRLTREVDRLKALLDSVTADEPVAASTVAYPDTASESAAPTRAPAEPRDTVTEALLEEFSGYDNDRVDEARSDAASSTPLPNEETASSPAPEAEGDSRTGADGDDFFARRAR